MVWCVCACMSGVRRDDERVGGVCVAHVCVCGVRERVVCGCGVRV